MYAEPLDIKYYSLYFINHRILRNAIAIVANASYLYIFSLFVVSIPIILATLLSVGLLSIALGIWLVLNMTYEPTETMDTSIWRAASKRALRAEQTRDAQQIEIATLGDIPAAGSGLGSSSTVTVGLLSALHAYRNETQPAETLARQACEIEIERLGKPIGKQDQYIAAYGGFRFIEFLPDERVTIEPLELASEVLQRLESRLMLFQLLFTAKKLLSGVEDYAKS